LYLALRAVEGIPTDPGFSKWRPLITAAHDIQLAEHQIRCALGLLKAIPPEETLESHHMSRGAWIYYHVTTWTFWMDALLERAKRLVKQGVRVLVRPSEPGWKALQAELLAPLESLSELVGKLRDPLAHGGGAIEALAEEHLWEAIVLLSAPVDFNQVFQPMTKHHETWYERLHKMSEAALATVEQAAGKLNQHIDWDRRIESP